MVALEFPVRLPARLLSDGRRRRSDRRAARERETLFWVGVDEHLAGWHSPDGTGGHAA